MKNSWMLSFLTMLALFPGFLCQLGEFPSAMPTEHQQLVQEEYEKFMKNRQQEKQKSAPKYTPPKGISPKELGMKRSSDESVELTKQVLVNGGTFWFGTQMAIKDKLMSKTVPDGSAARVKKTVKSFYMDNECVSNEQFQVFVSSTNYKTESELYGWSFVLESQVSEEVAKVVDGEQGYGRVKNSPHWMAVGGATWDHPYGPDSSIEDLMAYPVVHVSHTDATEYCAWAGLRLPNEREWEYAARAGRINQSFPWGNKFKDGMVNIWQGEFPKENTGSDGYTGVAPLYSFPANDYGIYNMLGNVWEWVSGGKPEARVLRGGSFIDSLDGSFNHAVRVSTKQVNSGDSSASNVGFRCAATVSESSDDGGQGAASASASAAASSETSSISGTPKKSAQKAAMQDSAEDDNEEISQKKKEKKNKKRNRRGTLSDLEDTIDNEL